MARLSRSARNIRWIQTHLRIPEGRLVGNPVRLTGEQKRWMRMLYDTPTRRFVLSMGRKNAKTAFSAMLLLLHTVGPEARPNSQLYSTALSRDQAAIVFNLAVKMVRMNRALLDVLVIRETAKHIECPELGTLYRALSADATTAHGLSPVFTVHDELGQVRGPRHGLYEALETASAAQQEPLTIIISTQAPNAGDLLSLLIDDAQTGADPLTKCVVYAAPTDAERQAEGLPPLDPFGDDAIRLANPHFNVFMNKAEVRAQAADAKRLPAREASYRNLILNQRVEVNNPFVTRLVWDENGAEPAPLAAGARVFGGLDLSTVSDLTADVLIAAEGEAYGVHPTFWLPAEGLAEKSRLDRVPYDIWAKQGFLATTPGPSIEYAFVAKHLRATFERYNVQAYAFDRYNWPHLKQWLERDGFSEAMLARFVPFGQGFQSMSPAIRELEALLLARKLRHAAHPVLAMCAANATTTQDPAENRKFIKHRATGRIDGMVALAMAVGVASSQPATVPAGTPSLQFW
jgi:phage terminase large subunit-like protein